MSSIVVNLLNNWKFPFQQVHFKRKLFGSLDLFNIPFYEKTLAKSAVLLSVEISFFCEDELHKILKFKYKRRSNFQTKANTNNNLLLKMFVSFQSFFFF